MEQAILFRRMSIIVEGRMVGSQRVIEF